MPILNGLETLKLVREDPRHANMPFIMLTAEAYKESIVAAVQARVSDYVAKPFTAEILLAKIAKVFARI
jgi:two-component system chemotaxis response regulator CheY